MARWTVARLMKKMALQGVIRGGRIRTRERRYRARTRSRERRDVAGATRRRSAASVRSPDRERWCQALSARSRQPPVPGIAAERAMGLGLNLRRDVAKGSSTTRSSSTPTLAASSVGGYRAQHTQDLCWTRWSRPCTITDPSPAAGSSTTPIGVAQSRSSALSVLPRLGSSRPSAASATTTTAIAETIYGLCKAEVFHRRRPRGARSKPSSKRRLNGSNSSTTAGFTPRQAASRLPRPKSHTTRA